jgi:GNAT superfamily N-acetyltransferase
MSLAATAVIRPAQGGERRACRMLMPELAGGAWGEPQVVVQEAPYRIFGALAWMPVRLIDGTNLWRLSFRLAPPFLGQGLGQQVLEHVRDLARQRPVAGLVHYLDAQAAAGSLRWLEAHGFAAVTEELVFSAPLAPIQAQIEGWLAWLRSRQGVPAGARVLPLNPRLLEPLCLLHAQRIGGEPWAVRRRLEAQLSGPHGHHNLALMLNDVPQGLLFSQPLGGKPGTSVISAKALDPDLQAQQGGLGWADLLLMAEGLALAQSFGHEHLQFSCLAGNIHTQALARRAGAEQTDHITILRRGLD